MLRVVGRNPVPWEDNRVRVVDRPSPAMTTWASLGSTGATQQVGALLPGILQVDAIPPVDERAVNPIGFLSTPTSGPAVLVQKGDRWRVQDGPRELVSVHPSGAITDADVARLRGVRSVAVEWGRHTGPIAAVRSIAGLAAAGVPVTASSVPYWAESLGSELTEILTSAKPSDLDDDLRREEHSIRLRRAALRTHAVRSRWRRLATQAGAPVPAPPKVSVLLCTKRPDFIGMALAQIARQRHVDLEVILTLHGLPASLPEVRAAVAGFALPVTTVEVPGDALFGEALNRGAAAASGEYLAKWDDDDWYGPEFIADAVLAADYSGADLVGCLHQFIYLEQINLTIRRPGGESERFTRQISGNSLLMSRRTFAAAGGFPAIPRNVDTGLLRVVEAAGGRIYRTHGMASMVHRRESGHTWNAPLTGFIRAATHQWRGFKPGTLTEVHGIGEAVLASGREVPGSV
ncbi:MAG: glycosyltransferase family 2 protein [Hamadaea sp.]|nr:glycosyltransferase family 2 protein [Hamadaea sp.]NUR50234.1 glycosyltransferase family 2 protein [Hamadaea sp.]